MPYIPQGVNEYEIEAAVQRAARALRAVGVVRIRHNFGPDWTGDRSIFFRIVVADEVADKPKLSDLAQKIALKLMNEVKTDEQGLHAYFNFRSLSEQAHLNEPAWA